MLQEGIKPDYITFVSVLSACGHSGLIDQGFSYFNSMSVRHDVNPGPEHYACMIDLVSRAGRLQEAKRFVDAMPIVPNASVWGALLGACLKYGDVYMGRDIAKKLIKIEPHNPGNYVLLSNLCSRVRKLDEADEVRRLMGTNRVKKEPGCTHDRSHLQTPEIYKMLEMLEV
ncbi:hypothetical protein LIER_23313 [Lithospermum erythrorhizon]|uniref:Pentatricopeptide repeat-containing protein n=1 Tax=Lithospermum erythrorhizon TaxID=34254 RepID=A0AAV3QZ94_LITER